MKLFPVFLLAAALSVTAHAEWHFVSNLPDGGARYVDLERARIVGGKVKVWTLEDYSKPFPEEIRGKHVTSIKALEEFDCKGETSRATYYVFMTGHMGSGEPIVTKTAAEPPEPVVPDTISDLVLAMVCKK